MQFLMDGNRLVYTPNCYGPVILKYTEHMAVTHTNTLLKLIVEHTHVLRLILLEDHHCGYAYIHNYL